MELLENLVACGVSEFNPAGLPSRLFGFMLVGGEAKHLFFFALVDGSEKPKVLTGQAGEIE